MNRRPNEPLTPEERALADQLARLGPHDGPSAALDARILAAAHEAVAAQPSPPRGKPRWPVAMGLAATGLLAIGIAWQLRPIDEARQVQEASAPADEEPRVAYFAVDSGAPPAAVALPAPPPPPPPPPPVSASKPAPQVASAPRQTPAPLARRAAVQAPPVEVAEPRAADVYTALPAPAAPEAPVLAAETTVTADIATAGMLAEDADRRGSVADPETTAAIAASRERARAEQARHAARVADAAARAGEAPLRRQAATAKENASATAGTPLPAAPAGPVRNALKRTDLQLPVSEDGKLPPEDWLERIRLRRDLGDRGSAADSLLRFKQSHPFQKVPDDLQELLAE